MDMISSEWRGGEGDMPVPAMTPPFALANAVDWGLWLQNPSLLKQDDHDRFGSSRIEGEARSHATPCPGRFRIA